MCVEDGCVDDDWDGGEVEGLGAVGPHVGAVVMISRDEEKER